MSYEVIEPVDLSPLEEDVNIIQALGDEPNDVDGLSAEDLKLAFDSAGNIIKAFINETLIPQLENEIGKRVSYSQLGEIVAGQIPERSLNESKLMVNAGDDGQLLVKDSTSEGGFVWANGGYTDEEILSGAARTTLGLAESATPDDAFQEIGVLKKHWWSVVPESGGATEYVSSNDKNAYPASGTQDGMVYRYLGIPFDRVVSAPLVQYGSYVGTGGRQMTLTFEFKPKAVTIGGAFGYGGLMWFYGADNGIVGGNDTRRCDLTWSENTLTVSDDYLNQYLNESGETYFFVAYG